MNFILAKNEYHKKALGPLGIRKKILEEERELLFSGLDQVLKFERLDPDDPHDVIVGTSGAIREAPTAT